MCGWDVTIEKKLRELHLRESIPCFHYWIKSQLIKPFTHINITSTSNPSSLQTKFSIKIHHCKVIVEQCTHAYLILRAILTPSSNLNNLKDILVNSLLRHTKRNITHTHTHTHVILLQSSIKRSIFLLFQDSFNPINL